MPYSEVREIGPGCLVETTGKPLTVKIGHSLIGKVVDSLGNNLDQSPLPAGLAEYLTGQAPPNPMTRDPVDKPIQMGGKGVESLLTAGLGQRECMFAGRGGGKSALLG